METNVKEVELRDLWRRYKDDGDERARERLVVAYSPLVKFVAGRIGAGLPSHVEEADLISYGLIGLIGAIERFEPEREIKFETFAVTRIRGAIIDELRSLDWVPRSVALARPRDRGGARRSSSTSCSGRRPTRSWPSELEMTEEELQDALLRDRQLLGLRARRALDGLRLLRRPGLAARHDHATRAPSTRRRRSTAARSRTASPRRSSRCPSASSSSSPSTTTRT